MGGVKKILESVLQHISPDRAEIVAERKFAEEVADRLRRAAPRGCSVEVAGSVAKGTFLKESKDMDVFLLLPRSFPKAEFEKIVMESVKKAFPKSKIEKRYAEHPYARLRIEGRVVDVVPAYRIVDASEMGSAVDRSVLHTRYIRKNLRKRLRGDVLLLKRFLKSIGVYGAEIRVEGFSGYLCELLVLYFGGFEKLIRNAARWKLPVVVDRKQKENSRVLLARFPAAALVIVDPVDENRNVAAVVSPENVRRFILACRAFCRNPSERFFFVSEREIERRKMAAIMRKGAAVFAISFDAPRVVEDILWGQLKRFAASIEGWLERNGFRVSGRHIKLERNKVMVLFRIPQPLLSEKIIMKGPEQDMEKHAERFKKAHKRARIFVKGKRLYAEERRKIRTVEEAIGEFLSESSRIPSYLQKKKMKIERIQ